MVGHYQISIHELRVELDLVFRISSGMKSISIHELRVELDAAATGYFSFNADFNPRAPCGARRRRNRAAQYLLEISIHELRVELD